VTAHRVAVASIALFCGCFSPEATTCGELVCPGNAVCSADGSRCILKQQLEACRSLENNADCVVAGAGGSCRDGVCELWRCGDGVRNGGEVCDGDDLGGIDCRRFGYANPDGLACLPVCAFDIDSCGSAIQMLAHATARDEGGSGLTYSFTTPAGDGLFLLVSVHVAGTCGADTPPVRSLTYNGAPLAPITAVVGTPCNDKATRSEQWHLVAPPVGPGTIIVDLEYSTYTTHSTAIVFSGVHQTTPIRATSQTKGTGTTASVAVDAAPGDIVVDTVGQGASILAPGDDQNAIVVRNAGTGSQLDNTAASWSTGHSPDVTMQWTFGSSDDWHLIATTLRRR
jgi:hypothetical protein